jgi:uncharacterized RDD family membrane protein YckC
MSGAGTGGARVGGVNAGFARRFAALLYDLLLVAAMLLLFTTAIVLLFTRGAITRETAGSWVYLYRAALLAIIAGYYVVNCVRSGQTLGMRAWHLRAVSELGRPLEASAALWRFVWGCIAWAPAGLGVLWLYVDPQHLALQDRLSRTRLVHLTSP